MPSIHILSTIGKARLSTSAPAKAVTAAAGAIYENGKIFGQSPWLVGGIAAAAGVGGYFLLKGKPEARDPRDIEDFYSGKGSMEGDSYADIQSRSGL
jgi:hypothetical protein